MRVAFIAEYDANDPGAQSGMGFHMSRALALQGLDVRHLQLRSPHRLRLSSAVRKAAHAARGRAYIGARSRARLEAYAAQASRFLTRGRFDVVMTPSTTPLALLSCPQPIVIWADTTARGIIGFYPRHSRLAGATVRDSIEADRATLRRCALAVFSSRWAAEVALEHYSVDPSKVGVVEFGANVESGLDMGEITRPVRSRAATPCRLVYLGSDWLRKGGPHAVDVVRRLRDRGLDATLTVIGPGPDGAQVVPDHVRVLDFVPIATEAGRRTISEALADADFFILPTRIDCCPIALAEASSFALPSLTTNIAGIPALVKDGQTGRTFDLDATPEVYVNYILDVLSSPGSYERLALGAYRLYRDRLNWTTAAARMHRLLGDL